MAGNKFIERLKGQSTRKSVLEVKNEATKASFANMPSGSSNALQVYDDARGDATAVLKGTEIWKLQNNQLVAVNNIYGDGRDFTSTYTVSGNTTWVNAVYTLDRKMIFTGATKWVLKLCGHSLLSEGANTINFSLLIKFNNSPIITKNFTVTENAFEFCKEFIIDFNESEQTAIKMAEADTITLQLLCADANASATIYNGMTTLVALQRRVDGEAVASDLNTFEDIEVEVAQLREDLDDLEEYVDDTFVRLDGTSVMTAPLKFMSGSMRGAVGPYLNGVSFWKMDAQGAITNYANFTDSTFWPVTTNAINLGRSANKWKDLYLAGKAYMSVINNGYDIAVPVTNSADTFALKSQVDLAANSGRMITPQGVWYAKMYAATVAPSAEDGTNYADFSQVDGQGNPIIVIYERQSGAWVQSETITPPAEYDGYVPITSKIWDIAEQAGQQGGRILWNHQSKEFTPYPQIISFEDIEVTGNSTVIMPQNPSASQIVNKDYVDNKVSSSIGNGTITLTQSGNTMGTFTTNQSSNTTIALDGGSSYHPDLFDWKWADHQLNDVQWLRADTFSWQDGGVYEAAYDHLVDDAEGMYDEAEFSVATQNANLGNNTWNDVAYGNGKFVALGNSGYISTSTDGINWITAIQDANLGSHIWSNIAYGNGRFVALGTTGYISTSTDGTTWSAATQDENIKNKMLWGVVYGNGKFVALTYSGYISTSTDGTTWTATTQDANLGNNTWRGIAYDGTKFVALGKDGHISTSTDGTTWTTATQNANLGSNNWYEITYDGTKFVALGETGYISTSTDGTTWTAATLDANLGNNSWHSIAYGNETLVALGKSGYISTASNFESETIAGTTIIYYVADDGHKIVLPDQETNVNAIYTATGSAWYYILDTENQRFKLPRSKHEHYGNRPVVGNGKTLGLNYDATKGSYMQFLTEGADTNGSAMYRSDKDGANYGNATYGIGVSTDPTKSGIIAQQEQDTDQYKYLYFYVGNFTQTALENTAGLNAELFNDKVDVGHEVIAFQAPTAENNYTWYKKYRDGWVEQGGVTEKNISSKTINLPIEMASDNYYPTVVIHKSGGTGSGGFEKTPGFGVLTTTTMYLDCFADANVNYFWTVSGMAA